MKAKAGCFSDWRTKAAAKYPIPPYIKLCRRRRSPPKKTGGFSGHSPVAPTSSFAADIHTKHLLSVFFATGRMRQKLQYTPQLIAFLAHEVGLQKNR